MSEFTPQPLRIRVGELIFDALVSGPPDGEPVLLLHGFPQTMAMWRPLLDDLGRQGYRCVAFNQRGYSPDARPDGVEAYRTDELAGDVVDVLDHLGWERTHLIGHDWGAAVAWRVALAAPERLRTLNVLSVGHPEALSEAIGSDDDQRSRSDYIGFLRRPDAAELLLADDAARLRGFFADSPAADELGDTLEVLGEPAGLDAALNWYRGAGRTEPGAPKVNLPVLFLWSDNDPALGRVAAERTGDHVAGPYRFVVLEGISHWIVQEAPGRVLAEVSRHISEHGS
ncbi:alpha/beta fold hydrolase [Enemella sp. A6]|uniref:alpha/beta fold hydrolase n=1 Tax=Enemella sp. A6 TaxID=3440152 RepID=UPI003EC04C85